MYLMNKYPHIYGKTELLTDYNGGGIGLSDLATDRNMLANGWQNRDGVSRSGTGTTGASLQSFWEAKAYWVHDWAPGTTILDGMVKTALDLTAWYAGSVLENAFPTWDFLWKELGHGEDVELTIYGLDDSFAHALTLTSLKFEDGNNNGLWDSGEQRKIDYLDPNNPTQFFESVLEVQGDGSLKFNWHNDDANTAKDVYIRAAYSESPAVPAPSCVAALVGMGATGLVVVVRRRHRDSSRKSTKA